MTILTNLKYSDIMQNANKLQKQINCKKGDTMAKSYSTVCHKKITEYLSENKDKVVTVNDIDCYLEEQGTKVNSSTIYRYLNRLSDEGLVMKYVAKKGEMSSFQYTGDKVRNCREHIHLRCVRCGKIIHLDCEFMEELSNHIMEHHGFKLQCESSVLYGVCEECRRKEI